MIGCRRRFRLDGLQLRVRCRRETKQSCAEADTGASCRFSLACCAKNFAQPFADDYFFSRLNRHGNELDMIDFSPLFPVGLLLYSFAHGRHEAGVVGAQHFDRRIVCAQLRYAVGNGEAPRLLIPRNFQCGIAVSVIGNVDFGLNAGNGFHQLTDAVHSGVPFRIKFFWIYF